MIKLYNTLSGKKEIFKPRKGKKVDMFVCGPTVYDLSHIGHSRSFLFYDMFAKYLKFSGFKVSYLENITDIDDKIINRAKERNIAPKKLSRDFEKEYLKDMKALRISAVSKYARATDYIKEIISQAERLMKKGFAYKTPDGIYYDIKKFKNYGKLSHRTAVKSEDAVSRIDEAIEKKNKGDFCLWKFSKHSEPKWKSPFGLGRPGWHIEDTAIAEKFFGFQYDIHGGAKELMFPHHEAEIAQMEAISGKSPMVKYWVHTGLLTINREKMAKSLGNFITIRDFIEEYGPRILRFFFLKSHYRSPVDYSKSNIHQAKKELERIDEFVQEIRKRKSKDKNQKTKVLEKTKKDFYEAMNNDINTPAAIASLFQLIKKANKNGVSDKEAKEIIKFLKEIDKFLGFIFWPQKKERTPERVNQMVKDREKARNRKDWQKADELRKKIEEMGYEIKDTKDGPKIKNL